jgi:hypothetical protein
MIKDLLAKIGGPVWRQYRHTKHHHIGAVIVIIVIAAMCGSHLRCLLQ